ncbi:MAG TPA: hypothetical protein VFP91_20515 [Vicinamibacterales bacterium]|nr:hypothetical protein [Vicinamibacterales bacterium]
MNTIHPPASGARLLKRLVPSQDHDVLLGDLHEEYQHGRSRAWYWFQIVAAVAASSWKDIRNHKLAALGAATLALAYLLIISSALARLLNLWRPDISGAAFVAVYKAIDLTISAVLGWLIVRLARDRGVTMVVAYCGFMLAAVCVVIFLSGIVVAAFHPENMGWHRLAVQYQSALTHQLVQDLLMLSAGVLATRRPGAA